MSIIRQNPVIIDNEDDSSLITYSFDVPAEDYSTSGIYPTELFANQTVVFEGIDALKNITDWYELDDEVTGDMPFFKIYKDFSFTLDLYEYSPWFPLTLANIQTIGANEKVSIRFRYSAIRTNQDFNFVSSFKTPDTQGWFNFTQKTSTTPYKFDKDYPEKGTLTWVLGHGTNGQVHLDTSTSKLYQKKNGVWEGGVFVVKEITDVFHPTQFNGIVLTEEYMESLTSKFGAIPINDYYLTNDIKFGKTYSDALTSTQYRPQQGDEIWINTAFQGINLTGVEELYGFYEFPTLPEGYVPKVYVKNLSLLVNEFIPVTTSEPIFCLKNVGDQMVFSPPFTLKMYSVDSFEVEVDGICSTSWNSCLDIKFRYSYNSRGWDTPFMPLTQANMMCIRGNPLKFFYIEFLFTKTCDNNGKPICVSDIVINGNFQNVSSDYDKLNRFGLRSDCNYGATGINQGGNNQCLDVCETGIVPHDWITDLGACGEIAPTFNPYNTPQVVAFNEKQANDVSNLFGWEIDYYRTAPDEAGIDYTLHEYGTFNTVSKQKIKILLIDNKFPEDISHFSMSDMALFDRFEIHITKKEFYSKFGIGVRPANQDFMFICQINKWFKVEHAQSFRDFMNSAIYYKVTLAKKENDKHIDNREFKDSFNSLIENNTLDNLLGKEVKEDIKRASNNPQLQNSTELNAIDTQLKYDDSVIIELDKGVTKEDVLDYKKPDPVISKINVPSIEAELENGTTVISKNYYDLTSRVNNIAVVYQKMDNYVNDCSNRSFTAWFSVTKYESGMVYNLIDNYNTITNKGYKIDFVDGRMEVLWNTQNYDIDVTLSVGVWYGIVVNFNLKQHLLELFIYKRKGNCTTNELELVNESSNALNQEEINDPDIILKLRGSYMKITNLRIFNEIVPKSSHSLVLSQYIVKNTEYLLLGDNASKIVIAPHWKY